MSPHYNVFHYCRTGWLFRAHVSFCLILSTAREAQVYHGRQLTLKAALGVLSSKWIETLCQGNPSRHLQ